MKAIPNGLALLLLALLAAPCGAQPRAEAPDPVVALANATVVDGRGGPAQPATTVLMQGGRILGLLPEGAQLPEGAEVVDLGGRYLLPGFFETHTHLTTVDLKSGRSRVDKDLRRLLYAGVTTIRDMAGDARLLAAVERDLLLGRIEGPEIHYSALFAGPAFMALDARIGLASIGHARGTSPWQQTASADTDIEQAVARAAMTGATGIKLYVGIEAPVMRRLSDAARRRDLQVWAHGAVFPDRPIEVVRAGVDAVSHLCWLAWQDADLDPSTSIPYVHQKPPADPRPSFDPTVVDPGSPEMSALFAEMARRGTILDATYSAYDGPEGRNCAPSLMTGIARAAHRAGVAFSTGTDWFTEDDDPFPSVTVEIERLVEGGVLTPAEAITAATLNGARATGLEDTHGTIEAGKVADLVVLAANPLEDIAAIRSVVTVYKGGRAFPRSAY
ncbi:amidohydrolase family protein [Luteimonas vadosa]|uniref:Amidohydrolase family protein n=1 Tax=Luteimonas vadosa TaxID=1165507 RepID=A0ABP9DRK1_9GAMM